MIDLDEYVSFKKAIKLGIYDSEAVQKHNIDFIKRKLIEDKDYFDHLYDEINPNISLDLEQRIAVLTNEDYNLIIAGAGSGKTTTMIGKIKYLIDKCNIEPSQILAISFSRKNVAELEEKLNKILKLNVETSTFHSLGLNILNQNGIKKEIIDDNKIYKILTSYFDEVLYNNKDDLKNMLYFLTTYLKTDKKIEDFDSIDEYHKYQVDTLYASLRGNLKDYNKVVINKRKKYRRTINSEYVRSNQELKIANFLYLNGLNYEYEKRYFKDTINGKVYHPDFTITQGENVVYLEHFGINQNGTSKYYSTHGQDVYNHNIQLKVDLHHKNATTLISTFDKFNDNRPLLVHLKELLEKNGFVLNLKSDKEVFDRIAETSKFTYFNTYIFMVMEFISKFKLNDYGMLDLDIMIQAEKDERKKAFLITFKPIYSYYEKRLYENNQVDFADMIVKAVKILRNNEYITEKQYKYIIVDEYQDISKPRFDLIKEFSDYFSANIVAVGDDWQAIFSFAGSNVELFTKFKESMGYAEILRITNTYRNSQELIDIAGEFVQKDENNLKKTLKSNKHIDKPVCIYSYDDTEKDVEKAKTISIIISDLYNANKDSKILLIGRYNKDITKLLETNLFKLENEKIICLEVPEANIDFATVHKSKGLEYDNVIIINAIDATYGFPSKIKDDPIFNMFNEQNNGYAEERRLFYVALTRTKNKVYIVVPKSKPSPFVIELKNSIHVEFKDDVVEQYKDKLISLKCPKCGGYLRKQYFDELDQNIYVCASDKHLCGFRTAELKHKIELKPCPNCDGYLIPKTVTSNNHLLLGCTNYDISDEDSCNYVEFVNL